MLKKFTLIISFMLIACHTANLKHITQLPKQLNEVSGNKTLPQSDLIWMLNDGGNAPKLYAVNRKWSDYKSIEN